MINMQYFAAYVALRWRTWKFCHSFLAHPVLVSVTNMKLSHKVKFLYQITSM